MVRRKKKQQQPQDSEALSLKCQNPDCSTQRSAHRMVQFGFIAKTGSVTWMPNVVHCGKIACYRAIEQNFRDAQRTLKERIGDAKPNAGRTGEKN